MTNASEDDDRADWVIACFESGRAELMFRIGHRDRWLKLALLVQAVIWAIAHGVTLVAEASTALPEIQRFALPVSCVFAALYYVEDGLIGRLSAYIGALPAFEAHLRGARFEVADWDASPGLRDYAKYMNLILRLLAQIAAFLILPGMLAVQHYGWSGLPALQWVAALAIGAVVILGYEFRRRTGTPIDPRKLARLSREVKPKNLLDSNSSTVDNGDSL